MTKVWYKAGTLRMRAGTITDILGDFVEIKDDDTNEFVIVPLKDTQVIKKTVENYIEL